MSWTHTPRLPILIWAVWAFPFTLWDTTYIFLRPHTLPGRKWHEPFFRAMDSWAEVDHTYGEQAWQEREGFTAAQGVINMLEVTLYMVYFFIAWRHGRGGVRGAFGGRWAARAVLVGFAAGTVTATKTSLYFMREVFSEYKFTGHAQGHPIWTLWGFMNFLYILASSYMMLTFGTDILDGLGFEEGSAMAKSRRL